MRHAIYKDGVLVQVSDIPAPAPTSDDVRAEASRRMQLMVGARDAHHLDIIISNGQREVARLNQARIGVPAADLGTWLVEPREWTEAERVRLGVLHAFDAAFEAIRAASNMLEGMPIVPADYADDRHWPPP